MDRVYRGYPQAIWEQMAALNMAPMMMQNVQSVPWSGAELQNMAMEPYMIYNREAQAEVPPALTLDDRRRIRAEYEYFRGLYPMSVRRWQRFVEEEFDRHDRPGSAIYDEYPDREMLYPLRDRIIQNAAAQGYVENQDLVMILVLNEMLKRRALRPQRMAYPGV